jgi:hypothetical protein
MHRDRALTWLLAMVAFCGCGGMLASPDAGSGGASALDAGPGADAASIDLGGGTGIRLPDAAAERSACDTWNFQSPATPIAGAACEYNVPYPLCDSADPQHIGVMVDGREIPRDTAHANGWDTIDVMNDIEIYGPSCDALDGGSAGDVVIIYKIILP